MNEVPSSITQCKKILKGVFINIFDYVDGKYDLKQPDRKALKNRCRERGFFPKKKAKSEHLNQLLQHLFN